MPSSFSPSLRLELQFTGENINLWGDKLNVVLDHADYAVAGWLSKALTGDYALTTANAGDDEARAAMLKFTGVGPFAVTIPSVSKSYDVWNACTAALTITTGAGTTVALDPGEVVRVICDGSNVKRSQATNFSGQQISNVADPTSPQQAATMAYVTAQIMGAFSGSFPGQTGANGWALLTNGVTPFWKQLTSADLSDTAARDAAALGRAVAMAVAL